MSGHSKWHNIQVRKGTQDKKRANIFSRLSRAITIAVKEGGTDPAANFKLRLAVEKAKSVSMPKDNIQRAIDKGAGKSAESELSLVSYEGKGPANIDVITEVLTDNKQRAVSEIKHIFSKFGGSLTAPGSVSWNFVLKGYLQIRIIPNLSELSRTKEEIILEIMDIGGIEDVEEVEGIINIYTKSKDLEKVRRELENKGYKIEKAELILDPKNTVKLDEKASEGALKLLQALDEYEETENVWTNMG